MNVDLSSVIYAYFFVGTAAAYGLWRAFRHTIVTLIKETNEEVCNRLTRIEYQLYNNGGESMKDAVDRIEQDVIELRVNQALIKGKMEA